ncbi:hypothetical protein SLA2020_525290 [Shorea laevis]
MSTSSSTTSSKMATNSPITTEGESKQGLATPLLRLTSQDSDHDELHRLSFAGHLLANEEDIRSGVVYSILKSA